MSLRIKLIWAFLVVVLVALVPAALILNWAMTRAMLYTGPRVGMMMSGGRGMGPGQGQGGMGSVMTETEVARQEALDTVRVWTLLSSGAAFAVAGAVGWWTAGRITRSVRLLRDASQNLGLRDLSRRVPAEGDDEIADLATSFNRMCDRLEAEERSRRQLLADVAHELRHPLAVMQGRLELMQDGKVPVEAESLLPLEDEVIRLTRLVGDLRDLSLAEVGGLSLHKSPVDLADLLETLLTNLEPVAAAKEIRLNAAVAPGLPAVAADGDRIRQVLVNLLANALQYTPRGGSVTVEAAQADGGVRIAIADTGPGIAPEDLPQVFTRFYRADKSRSRSTGGSGLGLAIVRSLVELHGGTVSVASTPGQGACFTVWLPVGG